LLRYGDFQLVGRQNADIVDTLHLRDVAMATTFWFSIGYNFGCMVASDTLFDSRGWVFGVKLSDVDSRFPGSKGLCHSNRFLLCIYGVHIDATWQI